MVDLNDKKNLPFVIGGVVLIIGAAVFFIYKQFAGPQIDVSTTASVDTTATAQQPVSTAAQKLHRGGAAAPAKPATATATATATTGATTATPAAGTTPPAGGAIAGKPGAAANTNAGTKTADATPVPRNEFRLDPFAPLGGNKSVKKQTPVIPRLAINPPVLWHPTPPPIDKYLALKPLPKRRVAAILLGNRISALLQTEDKGFETVRPGSTLSDGSVVQRIERDRVVIKTAEAQPRIVEVKLAAAEIELPQSSDANQTSGATRRRSGGYGGSDGRPM